MKSLEKTISALLTYRQFTISEYMIAYRHYCTVDLALKKKEVYLNNLKITFIKNKFIAVEFPPTIEENFSKIVNNIYYITAYKTWLQFKKDFLDKNENEKDLTEKLYQTHLKASRKEVYAYFKMPKLEEINIKYLFRLYPFSLSKNTKLRQDYYKTSEQVNIILANIQLKIIPTIFLTESVTSDKFKPRDVKLFYNFFFRKLLILKNLLQIQ